MQVKRYLSMSVAAAAVVVGLAACGDGGEETLDLGGDESSEMVATTDPTPRFEPAIIEVNPGNEVTFSLKNDSDVSHNFSVSYIGIDRNVEPGQTIEISLPPLDAGTLTFYDKKYQGEGMWGKIRVE